MNKFENKMKPFLRVNQGTIRLIVTIACLVLFVLAAGAPGGLGGIGMQSVDNSNVGGQCSMSMKALNHMNTNALDHMSLKSPVYICVP